ncbi:hypothetical protein [Escherichia coli]|uniref:hypothetical protein n=1 Tax=Escherichia coli TaxID=562 RepID=UPI00200CE754|nr:hypothetical protein [Escherichia coli]
MNQLLIVTLAVCLVSVHSFVKRDAPASEQNADVGTKLQKEFSEWATNVQKQLAGTFDPDKMKEDINKGIDTISKKFEEIKASFTEKKE